MPPQLCRVPGGYQLFTPVHGRTEKSGNDSGEQKMLQGCAEGAAYFFGIPGYHGYGDVGRACTYYAGGAVIYIKCYILADRTLGEGI